MVKRKSVSLLFCHTTSTFKEKVKLLVHPALPDFQNNAAFCKDPRLSPLALLVRRIYEDEYGELVE